MIILNKTQIIKKLKCEIKLTEFTDKHISHCQVICSGKSKKNQWEIVLPSTYGGYAMLLDKHLIDLPSKLFLVRQINEHSRGGHHEHEIHVMNLFGKVINRFTGGYNSRLLLDEKHLWMLVSGKNYHNPKIDRDLDLIKLNIKTGQVKQTIKINYPHLLNCSYSYIVTVQLSVKHNKGILQIKYSDGLKEIQTKRTELTNL